MKLLSSLFSVVFIIWILFLQSGCKDTTTEPIPDVTASADTIYGTVKLLETTDNFTRIVNWHYGPAMIRADKKADAALTSDGNFILVLPATVKGADFTSMNDFIAAQGGSCAATPAGTNFAGAVQFTVDYTDNGVAKNMAVGQYVYVFVDNQPVISKTYSYNFYSQDGTFTGNSSFGKTYNWSFAKGWGAVEFFYSSSTSPGTSNSVAQVPANALWTN